MNNPVKDLSDIEARDIVIRLLRHLDGLSVGQAKRVLQEAASVLQVSTRLDINSPEFNAIVEEFEI